MSDERRYQEDEVREIFEAAADARDTSRRALSSGDGMSLTELQEIGLEVGLSPERIAEAASALELRRSIPPAKTYLGMPLSVGRSVELPRAPTDLEWELLVSELRDTFQARGELDSQGNLRQWTNGNLHAYIEPTETGHRLRLQTLKGNVLPMTVMGLAGIGMALLLVVALFSKDRLAAEYLLPIFFGGLGAGTIATVAATLPGWARTRAEQMEYIAARAQVLIGPEPEPESSAG